MNHRNITRVHDYGTVGSGGAYLIMELVAGQTWRAELQRRGVIVPARAAEWFRQLLDGLRYAHNLGIVHRDLKPENVMVVEMAGSDEIKVMDFGLAKILDAGGGPTETVTVGGMAMGTLGYMAPEVLTGGVVDERADLFAIGVMVVETLVGVRPFAGQTPEAVLTALLRAEYHLPGDSPETRAVDSVVQRCLAKDARDRYGFGAGARSGSHSRAVTLRRIRQARSRHFTRSADTRRTAGRTPIVVMTSPRCEGFSELDRVLNCAAASTIIDADAVSGVQP